MAKNVAQFSFTHTKTHRIIPYSMKNFKFAMVVSNVVIVLVLASSFLVAYFAVGKKESDSLATNAIYKGDEQGDGVALMFNVYERADNVEKIMQTFQEYGMNCTFFVGGSWVAKNPNTLIKLHSNRFEIGNHGYLHRDHAKLSYDANVREITLTGRLVTETLKDFEDYKQMTLFAPPSGSIGSAQMKACEDLGYKVIMWTRDTIDWRDHDADVIFARATKNLTAGELILLHPTDATVEALPRILDYLNVVGLKADVVSNVI